MMPSNRKPVPSVAMNDGSPSVTVKKALNQPATRPHSNAMRIAGSTGTP